MDKNLQELLESTDSPTIVNAIEIAQESRDFSRFTKGQVVASEPGSKPIVGLACTATIRAKHPPKASRETIKKRRNDYYFYLANCEGPAMIVIEDLDYPEVHGAWWGEVNSTVHRALGLKGVLTNGSVRDLDQLAEGFPILAGEIGVSHAHVHIVNHNIPVTVFDLTIYPGELIHADRHGAVVIPEELLGKLPDAITRLQESEALVIGPAKSATNYDVEQLIASWDSFEAAIKK